MTDVDKVPRPSRGPAGWTRSWLTRRERLVMRSVGKRGYQMVLDLGCGNGELSVALSSSGKRVISGDISRVSVMNTMSLANSLGVEIDGFTVCRGESLPFRDGTFDVVTCLEVIEHVDCPIELLLDIERVLKPGGRLILSTPNAYYYIYLLRHLLRRAPIRIADDHYYLWDIHTLNRLLDKAGFRVQRNSYAGFHPPAVNAPEAAITRERNLRFLEVILNKFSLSIVVECARKAGPNESSD